MQASEVDVDRIQHQLGCGRFQLLVFLSLGLIYSRGAWHVFGGMFLAGDPGHQCALPKITSSNSKLPSLSSSVPSAFDDHKASDADSNMVLLSLHNGSGSYDSGRFAFEVPLSDLSTRASVLHSMPEGVSVDVTATNLTVGSCTLSYMNHNGSQVQLTQDCPYGWTYGSLFDNTVLSEWDLVCDRDYLVELSITVFMLGATGGAVVLLPLADRWGRKTVMLGCLLAQVAVGTATAFVNSYEAFTMLRFIIGMLNIGVGMCSYVLMTEMFPAKRRSVVSIAFQAFWALGVMTLAGFGFLLRNWRHLELVMTLPNLLALPLYWILPESLPWLVSRKKWSEAITTINTIAKINRKDPITIITFIPTTTTTTTTTSVCTCCCLDNTSTLSLVNQNAEDTTSSRSSANQNAEDSSFNRYSANQNTEDRQNCSATQSEIDAMIDTEHCSRNVIHGDNILLCADDHIRTETLTEGNRKDGCIQNNGHAAKGNWQFGNGSEEQTLEQKTEEQQQSVSILDLFRHRRMGLYSCIMFFLFFVNSLGYFGISFSVPTLHGNQFLNLFIMGAVEIPANIICVIVSHRVGRRYPSALFLLLCGLCNIAAIFLPSHIEWLKLVMVMVGKFAITATYATVYLYAAEIFPTVIRNQAMGVSSVFENIGSISAPFIVLAAKSVPEVPLVVFGVLTVGGAGLTLLLPETHNRPLPQTVHEIITW